ncbi:MAG: hypothetical protein B7Y08_21250 [Rhodospirillales bacterium 24-66-33]|jgi:hypothetical protein|uniref:hypothetical protein n=2 Tax=Reyranella sp. TaxID=1929291 RepID=UPI00086C763A|nr:hypothetical protein [Reyranella sp.]ODT23855.1 MAG: hypothetical protein ABS54_10120 [Hyphomicrobium sp. SCN 65-11]OYY40134.1 MAG: hypothetical protein B7Y57_18655 [Rhodospirillales bacterium 35-66-84]OYZ92543.1 MAG: hypothetical protein B7Y08_21250 [Rhodospirillales bacterium 24-66-33]OZB23851.1 MAG: hypothetical protein B7X63_18115 [Rhodospirillales bacterium 39-66-50]HQS16972.1 hypothetical protein [Reyranella sp.]
MPIPTKTEIQAFEARLDRALAERVTNRCNANAALRLASNMAEVAATTQPTGSGEGVLNDGINSFSAYLVSGTSGPEPALEALFGDLDFGFHYHHLRGLLYYSYNAPGSIDWRFAENRIELRFLDPSLPRQFFTVWNENVLGSQRIFDGFDVPDKLRELLKNQPEFELGEAHEAADKLLQAHADLKLSAYFSILDTNSEIDLGGYSYREIYAVYRILLMKALYHRHQAAANDHTGCVHVQADELRDMLAQETKIDAAKVEAMLQDLVFDSKAAEDRVDSTYFSLMREGAAPRDIIIRPCHFSKADGLVQLLRVVAQRRPHVFLSQVSNALAAAFVQRVKAAFEAQGFLCQSEISLRAIDPALPDIDLLVIVEEPTLGFVMLICEVKSPLPPQWAKDQLRALAKDNVSKAFRQTEAISTFLRKPEGIEFIRSVVPKGGLEHFDSFVTVLQQLIITSDNAGMFFGHEETPIINFRTLERLLQRADGDILHMRYCISHYNEWADECVTTAMATVEVDGLTVLHEGFTPTRLMDFPQTTWNSSSDRQRMIDDFVANGHHPFDCLVGREGVIIAPPTDAATDARGPLAKPI